MNGRRIHLLDDTLVDQIAAGEVVERPASAVKELLENAVDAGASRVDLEIEDGGKTLIRVSDDGSGMSPEDAQLALRRHATSKIRSFDDLLRVRSLGFRGEALPSIASVSRFSLRTRPHDATRGTDVRVEGGGAPDLRPAGGAAGTTVEVRDLFYNVPARRKFLKATHAEAARVHDAFLRVALAHPAVRFTYRSGGRELRSLPPALGLPGRAAAVFSSETLDEIAHAERGLRFEAMLGAGESSKPSSRQLYLFVNDRAVMDPALTRAIVHGFGADLPPGRFPVGVVHVHLPPEEVDVNVHPRKTEVRLVHGPDRHRQIRDVVATKRASGARAGGPAARGAAFWEERLERSRARVRSGADASGGWAAAVREPTAAAPPRDRWGVGTALVGDVAIGDRAEAPTGAPPRSRGDDAAEGHSSAEAADALAAPPRLPNHRRSPRAARTLRFLARAHGRFIVCESVDGVALVDARRGLALLTEATLRRALESGSPSGRTLVFPPRVEVDDAPRVVERRGARLERLGFEVTPLSPTTLAVHAAPAALTLAPEEALRVALRADDEATAGALAEAEAAAGALDDDRARAIIELVETLEEIPPGLLRAIRFDPEERE